MAKPFLVPAEETPSSRARTSSSSASTTTAAVPPPSSTAVASTSQPQTPSNAAPASAAAPPVMQLNSEYLMLAFVEAVERYYRDAQGGRLGYYGSAPPTPSYYTHHSNDIVFSCDDLQSSQTDRFYGTRRTSAIRRNRSNSFPLIRSSHLTATRPRDENNNDTHDEEESSDDENVSIRFARDLKARQNMQEFTGCIPKRRRKNSHVDENLEISQHETIRRGDNTRDNSSQPKEKNIALSFIFVSVLAIGFGLFAARKI